METVFPGLQASSGKTIGGVLVEDSLGKKVPASSAVFGRHNNTSCVLVQVLSSSFSLNLLDSDHL